MTAHAQDLFLLDDHSKLDMLPHTKGIHHTKKAFKHLVDNQKSYASILHENFPPPPTHTHTHPG